MVSAVILLEVEKAKVNEVAEKLVELQGVTEVYSVAGQYDLVVVARVRDNEAIPEEHTLRKLIVTVVSTLDGYAAGEGGNVFDRPNDLGFDRYNLERMFSIGMEEPPPGG